MKSKKTGKKNEENFLISWYSGSEWHFMAEAAIQERHCSMLPIQQL